MTIRPGANRGAQSSFAPPCLSLDLEVGRQDRRIHAFAAVRLDTDQRLIFGGGNLTAALAQLDDLAQGATFLLGHNLITFDLPHLAAAKPDLRLFQLPAVDTLWLSPLAFPYNPYHRLVKHYQGRPAHARQTERPGARCPPHPGRLPGPAQRPAQSAPRTSWWPGTG